METPKSSEGEEEPVDSRALQQTYRKLLIECPFSDQTVLARHLRVRRVWVVRVLDNTHAFLPSLVDDPMVRDRIAGGLFHSGCRSIVAGLQAHTGRRVCCS
jgi:hypothetical protein